MSVLKAITLYYNSDDFFLDYITKYPEIYDAYRENLQGNFLSSFEKYDKYFKSINSLDDIILKILYCDYQLLCSKLAKRRSYPKLEKNILNHQLKYILAYSRYLSEFWADHKAAQQSSRKMIVYSIVNSNFSQLLLGLFSFSHLNVVKGSRGVNQIIASLTYHITKKRFLKNKISIFYVGVPFSCYAYTLFILGRLKKMDKVLKFSEKYTPEDSFFKTTELISSFYGYSYTGQIAKLEETINKFKSLIKKGAFIRYKPLLPIMKALSLSLRGMADYIKIDFLENIKSFHEQSNDPIICSQFYRAASIIFLILGDKGNSAKYIQKAIFQREKTGSFNFWANIDNRIINYCKMKRYFNPLTDKLIEVNIEITPPPQLNKLLCQALHTLSIGSDLKTEDLYYNLALSIFDLLGGTSIKKINERSEDGLYISICNYNYEIIGLRDDEIKNSKELLALLSPVISHFSKIHQNIKKVSNYNKELERVRISKQVAHDIRSPLAALDIVLSDILELPEEKRSLVRNATSRINDIADNLLSSYKNPNKVLDGNKLQVCMLSGLIAPIVAEKRTLFRKYIDIEIETHLSSDNYGTFVEVNPVEFKRILSNLINNSIESISNIGKVEIKLNNKNNRVYLQVIDTGSGIPKDVLPKLTKEGASFGKKNGAGLGLHHAKTSVGLWKGELLLESKEGVGTKVTIVLPSASKPDWFLKQLHVQKDTEIIILDDDTSIHQVWKSRFSKFDLKNLNISLKHFTDPIELKKWFKNKDQFKNYVYLFDLEILGSQTSGLDLIMELEIKEEGILVTSRYEEKEVLERCKENNIHLLPKNLATYIPIEISQNVYSIDAVLVDDDELIRRIWLAKAKKNNINLKVFSSESNFLDELINIPKATPIYIDSNLGESRKGEDLAFDISKKGYRSLYLATGYESSEFQNLTFLKGVIGKTPPWR